MTKMQDLNVDGIGAAILISVLFGWWSDRFKYQWKIIFYTLFFLILFGFGILLDIMKHNVTDPNEKQGTGFLFDLSVPLYFGFHACLHMLAEAYLAKIVNF